MLSDINTRIEQKTSDLLKLKKHCKLDLDDGACLKFLDATLLKMGVDRKPYYGKCFVGNHCHVILQNENIKSLCDSIFDVVSSQTDDILYQEKCRSRCNEFSLLFKKFSECDNIFNSACVLSDEIIGNLECSITDFEIFSL